MICMYVLMGEFRLPAARICAMRSGACGTG